MEEKEKEEKEKEEKKEEAAVTPKEEPSFEIKSNPARVTTIQREFISCDAKSRWQPVKPSLFGIVLLRDTQPSLPVALVTDAKSESSSSGSAPAAVPAAVSNATATIEDVPERDEAPMPEEFDFEE